MTDKVATPPASTTPKHDQTPAPMPATKPAQAQPAPAVAPATKA